MARLKQQAVGDLVRRLREQRRAEPAGIGHGYGVLPELHLPARGRPRLALARLHLRAGDAATILRGELRRWVNGGRAPARSLVVAVV